LGDRTPASRRLLSGGRLQIDLDKNPPKPGDSSWVSRALPRIRDYEDRNLVLLANGEPIADSDVTPEQRETIIEGFFEMAARRVLTLIPMLGQDSAEMATFRIEHDLAQARPGGRLETFISDALVAWYESQMTAEPEAQILASRETAPAETEAAEFVWDSAEGRAAIMASLERTPHQETRAQQEAAEANGAPVSAETRAEMVLAQLLAAQGNEVPLGLAVRVVQVGPDEPGRKPEEVFAIGLSIDYDNPQHIAFRDALQAMLPDDVHVLNPPPFARRGAAPGGAATKRPAMDLDL